MRAVLLPVAVVLATAGCDKPQPAPAATPSPIVQPAPKGAAVPLQAPAPVAAPLGERWRGVPTPSGLAAVFGPAKSDNSAYRMECRDSVLTIWVFHEEGTPPGRAAGELLLRKASGEILVRSSADAEPDDLGTRLVFNLPQSYFDPADREPALDLGIALPGEAAGWTQLNDVARDILMACAVA
jgi:hypothetical protein